MGWEWELLGVGGRKAERRGKGAFGEQDGGAVSGEVDSRNWGRVAALMRGPEQGRVRSGCAGSSAGWWPGSASFRVFPAMTSVGSHGTRALGEGHSGAKSTSALTWRPPGPSGG